MPPSVPGRRGGGAVSLPLFLALALPLGLAAAGVLCVVTLFPHEDDWHGGA